MNKDDLHGYQLTSIDHILDTPNCGLFLDMGLGKTVSTLTACNELLYERLEVAKVLVIAPKRVAENVWTDEVLKWEHLKHIKVSRIMGNEKQRRHALASDADVYTISRENVPWLCGLYGGHKLPFDMCVIDESSSFKNPKSSRFKALRRIESFTRIVILSGTPAPNGLIDLWSQIYLLDRGQRLGDTLTAFRQNYFTAGQASGHVVYNYKIKNKTMADAIHTRISDICISMKAKDYLKLPGVQNNYIPIKFNDAIQHRYDLFEIEKVLEFLESEQEVNAVNAAALSNKLLQFANGAVYDEDHDWHEVHKLKLEACTEIVEDAAGKSVLIAWTFKHDRDRLINHLKRYKPVELKGEKEIKDWNEGNIQVMLMHPASGGHGLNLQFGGNIIVWFGQTWSLELYQQFNARLARQGQKYKTIINHLVAVKTIEQKVIKALEGKDRTQESLLSAIKATIERAKR